MAHGEDCQTVLEQFVHDVANLPAEISHLMEEIQAKDKIIQECRAVINSRDNSLQKFIKLNGSHVLNPKEEACSKTILQNMDRCQILQDEKVALSDKASVLLDRHVKRLDIKIRDLQRENALSKEPAIPSLFQVKSQYREPPKALFTEPTTTGPSYGTPLSVTSGNANAQPSTAQRLNVAAARTNPQPKVPPTTVPAAAPTVTSAAPALPSTTGLLQQRFRESSVSATDNKRRRLNMSISSLHAPTNTLPAAPSTLRQSSTGPGTPKAGTPGITRAESIGPRPAVATKKPATKKVAPHQQIRKIKAGGSTASGKLAKRSSSKNRLKPISLNSSGGTRKKSGSPASAGGPDEYEDESALSSAEVSEVENKPVAVTSRRQVIKDSNDEADDDDEDETGEDSKTYCTCRSVSHGDMVACDNDGCPYEWFHWKCVGLTREPLGTWFCDECRKTLGK